MNKETSGKSKERRLHMNYKIYRRLHKAHMHINFQVTLIHFHILIEASHSTGRGLLQIFDHYLYSDSRPKDTHSSGVHCRPVYC